MAPKSIFFPGWYQYVWIIQIILGMLIIVYFSLSPYASEAISWYKGAASIVLLLVILDLVSDKIGKFSFMPSGEYNPAEYPLQKLIGYNWSVFVALMSGVVLATLFGISIYTQNVIYFPIPQESALLTTISTGPSTFLTGLVHSIPPTVIENPLLILVEYGILKKLIKGGLTLSRVPPTLAAILGTIFAILIAALIFPFIYHYFAYGGIEPAYYRAFLIVAISLIPVALTGMPIPLDLTHFTNNFIVATLQVVGFGLVIIVPGLAARIGLTKWLKKSLLSKNNKVFKHKLISLFKSFAPHE